MAMSEVLTDAAHLRELAQRCRRAATKTSDAIEVASLRQMATEYEALADQVDRPGIPNLLPPQQ
jgi:hypothetical protein